MPRMVLMCGIAGAGKSTYARRLEAQGWRRFTIDAGAWSHGYTSAAAIPDGVAVAIRAEQRTAIEAALAAGEDVVVDYSFWSRRQRDDYRALGRGLGASVEVVYLEAPEPLLRARLADRRGAHADDFVVDDDLLDRYLAGFQAPGADEPDVTVLAADRAPEKTVEP